MKNRILYCAILLTFTVAGCKKYLDVKSDSTTSTIETANDLLMLLNYENLHITNCQGLAAADEYYVPEDAWLSVQEKDRENYSWNSQMQFYPGYIRLYENVLYANIIISNADKVKVSNEQQRAEIKGMGLFLRGYAFLQAAELYAMHYKAGSVDEAQGIVLRLDEEQGTISRRSSLIETYRQITSDLEAALPLLPLSAPYKNRPIKAAGYALLARLYLQTEQYSRAVEMASACLALRPQLLDFNSLNEGDAFPLGQFATNPEILYFQTVADNLMVTYDDVPRVDTVLRAMYAPGDLRGSLYFRMLSDGTESFRNSYSGSFRPFTGICTDEVYLIRAECLAREGKVQEAMDDLNTLLSKRWRPEAFVPVTAGNTAEALQTVLNERRKELVLRGVRWADLKRLNTNPSTAVTLTRMGGGSTFILSPNDKRYALLLPQEVISRTSIAQTTR
ncbi:RagB/SusD family nutrient uptake outer membrane protein [Chitinophaga deserti]|uniref:RagB/SusD family nutrient uptake outer membrane protein n=1 Tax=Chitinophaga deserti TaxID=2164099 RepID=UPI000D6BC811|nr:RagB/SusD family nutrient uptake outer membrane protein [Chitinophaga deserti]